MRARNPSEDAGSTKERLISVGRTLLWKKGYNDTGIQEVLKQSGAPKGSFYHHFKSKEDFGLQVLDRFAADSLSALDEHLADSARSPLQRLKTFFEAQRNVFNEKGCVEGCMVGNFGQELADTHETFRLRVHLHMQAVVRRIASCLGDAQIHGELPETFDVDDYADVLFSAWQGAMLRMKVRQSIEPIDVFLRIYFQSGNIQKSQA